MDIVFLIFLFLFGTAVGSFLNVLIDRLPNEKSIMGRSHCDNCKKKLAWYDMFPIISYFLLKGKCRYCKKKLSFQYPLVEFITGFMFVLIWTLVLPSETAYFMKKLVLLGIISCLIVIFFTDLKYRMIPDSVQMVLFALGFFFPFAVEITAKLFFFRAISAFVVMSPILFLHFITKGKGMGFGDVKLGFIIGFLLGLKAGLISLYLAFILGAAFGLILIIFKKRKLKSKIAFGPFLVLGMLIIMFWKDTIFLLLNNIYGL